MRTEYDGKDEVSAAAIKERPLEVRVSELEQYYRTASARHDELLKRFEELRAHVNYLEGRVFAVRVDTP